MGIVLEVEKNKKVTPTGINNDVEVAVSDVIAEVQVEQFMELQLMAHEEINEEIDVLTREGVMSTKGAFRHPSLRYALVTIDDELIGYGYGYQEGADTFKIDTVYIKSGFRGQGISKRITNELLSFADTLDNVKYLKGVTQPGNISALTLMKSFNMSGLKMIRITIESTEGVTDPQISIESNDSRDPISMAIVELLENQTYLDELVAYGRAVVVKEEVGLKIIDYRFN